MRVYRCKICGATKSRKNGEFTVPSEPKEWDPGKMRLMLHIAAAHLDEGEKVDDRHIEIVEI